MSMSESHSFLQKFVGEKNEAPSISPAAPFVGDAAARVVYRRRCRPAPCLPAAPRANLAGIAARRSAAKPSPGTNLAGGAARRSAATPPPGTMLAGGTARRSSARWRRRRPAPTTNLAGGAARRSAARPPPGTMLAGGGARRSSARQRRRRPAPTSQAAPLRGTCNIPQWPCQ